MILLDSATITTFIRSHSDLLQNLKLKHLGLLDQSASDYERRKAAVLKNIRKINQNFWEDMIFTIGPRINEFDAGTIVQILQSACKPRIGKRDVTR